MSLLPVDEAIAAILSRVPAPVSETVRLAEAAGRVLIDPVVARHDQPPFDASAMDGYAVRAADIVPGHQLTVIGQSQAGAGHASAIATGQAVRIFTGAPLPPGADTVIMQEEAHCDGDLVQFTADVRPGHSVRRRGYDFASGQTLINTGTRLTPMHLTVAAAANCASVQVAKRPQIAILATGDELMPPGTQLGIDQIVASNSYGLVPLLSPYAQSVVDHGIARDDRTALRQSLERIFDAAPDVVVTTGGASVGDHDIVQDILLELGVTLDFWKINMRPGKPLMFGTLGKTLVFGLPGNPVSAMVTAIVFIKPALRAWLRHAEPMPWRLPLAAPMPPNTARRHFMRATLQAGEHGLAALPISQTDSGHTSSLARADLLVIQPEFDPGRPVGSMVDTLVVDAF